MAPDSAGMESVLSQRLEEFIAGGGVESSLLRDS